MDQIVGGAEGLDASICDPIDIRFLMWAGALTGGSKGHHP